MQHAFGYARVSATNRNLDTQLEDLTRAGCTRIFQEKVSGTRTSSQALDELLAQVRGGDVVVVNRLARLGRNTVHTIQLVEEFNRRGVHFRALDLSIDSRTPAGKMIISVFSSFNQYERENNREKSLAGIKLAKTQGKHLGRLAGRDIEMLHDHQAVRSQSRRGDCYDNAQAQSLWSRLKTEVLEGRERPVFADLADAQASVADYFDYYNHERLHSSIDYQTPYHTHQQLLQLSTLNCPA